MYLSKRNQKMEDRRESVKLKIARDISAKFHVCRGNVMFSLKEKLPHGVPRMILIDEDGTREEEYSARSFRAVPLINRTAAESGKRDVRSAGPVRAPASVNYPEVRGGGLADAFEVFSSEELLIIMPVV